MRALHILLLLAVTLAVPFTGAHPMGVGLPKTVCESPRDMPQHEYGPPATGLVIALGQDGAVPPCPAWDPTWDGHLEFAAGGAWLLACDFSCGAGYGDGALTCWGAWSDHAPSPTVTVDDAALLVVGFEVWADRISLFPQVPECGDFEADAHVVCVNACQIPFGPGLDGSYAIYVQGTTGHVFSS